MTGALARSLETSDEEERLLVALRRYSGGKAGANKGRVPRRAKSRTGRDAAVAAVPAPCREARQGRKVYAPGKSRRRRRREGERRFRRRGTRKLRAERKVVSTSAQVEEGPVARGRTGCTALDAVLGHEHAAHFCRVEGEREVEPAGERG